MTDITTEMEGSGPRVALLSPVADPQVIAWTAQSGVDIYILDCEHGPLTVSDVHNACRAGRAAGIETWVRIPVVDRVWVGQALDAGAAGLLIPHVTTPAAVRQLLEYAQYPPHGDRGIAGVVGNAYGRRPLEEVDASVALWIQFEDRQAIDDVGELLAAGLFAGALIGPADLKGRLEGGPEQRAEQLVKLTGAAFDAVHMAGRQFGIVIGDPSEAAAYRERGVEPNLIIVGARFELVARLSETDRLLRGSARPGTTADDSR